MRYLASLRAKSRGNCGTVPPLLWAGRGEEGAAARSPAAACSALLLALARRAAPAPSPTLAALRRPTTPTSRRSRARPCSTSTRSTRDSRRRSSASPRSRRRGSGSRPQRATLGRELRLARVDARLSQHRLASRLRFLYEHGTTSSLDVADGREVARGRDDAARRLQPRRGRERRRRSIQVQSAQRHMLDARGARSAPASARSPRRRPRPPARPSRELAAAAREPRRLHRRASRAGGRSTRSKIARLHGRGRRPPSSARRPLAAARREPSRSPPPPPRPSRRRAAVAPGLGDGRTLTVVATGYDLPGHTSTGLPVGWGIAAVDPSVIPLGTRIVVPGYGVAVAADTGGAIVGATIDLWFPTAAQADAWGRRTVTIAVDRVLDESTTIRPGSRPGRSRPREGDRAAGTTVGILAARPARRRPRPVPPRAADAARGRGRRRRRRGRHRRRRAGADRRARTRRRRDGPEHARASAASRRRRRWR